jgi:hypothetical protein
MIIIAHKYDRSEKVVHCYLLLDIVSNANIAYFGTLIIYLRRGAIRNIIFVWDLNIIELIYFELRHFIFA